MAAEAKGQGLLASRSITSINQSNMTHQKHSRMTGKRFCKGHWKGWNFIHLPVMDPNPGLQPKHAPIVNVFSRRDPLQVACPRLHLATVDNGLRQGLLCSRTPEELRQMSVGHQADESGRITWRGASSAQHHAIAEKTSWGDPGRKCCRRSDQALAQGQVQKIKKIKSDWLHNHLFLSSRACMHGRTPHRSP